MVVKNTWNFHHSIKVDFEKMEKLQNILEKFFEIESCIAKLSDDETIYFASFEELLLYENFEGHNIISLDIEGKGDSYVEKRFSLVLSPQFSKKEDILKNFHYTVACTYRIRNLNESIELKDSLFKWANSCKTTYFKLAPLNLVYLVFKLFDLLTIPLLCLLALGYLTDVQLQANTVDIFSLYITLWGIVILLKFLHYIDEHFTRRLFPPIVFYWGDEIKRQDNLENLRKNLFWVLVMGIVVSVTGAFIYAGLTNGG